MPSVTLTPLHPYSQYLFLCTIPIYTHSLLHPYFLISLPLVPIEECLNVEESPDVYIIPSTAQACKYLVLSHMFCIKEPKLQQMFKFTHNYISLSKLAITRQWEFIFYRKSNRGVYNRFRASAGKEADKKDFTQKFKVSIPQP